MSFLHWHCKMKKHKKKEAEDILFVIGLIFIAVFSAGWPIFLKAAPYLSAGCRFYALTGFYCPACGGTRALNALLRGRLITSLQFNPAVAFGAAVFAVFMITQAIERLSRHRIKIGLKYKNIYIYLWLGILMGWWLVKNTGLILK